jgi:hypothetical protein
MAVIINQDLPKHSVNLIGVQVIEDLATCQRVYSELHRCIPPSCPKMCALALSTLRRLLERQKQVQGPIPEPEIDV